MRTTSSVLFPLSASLLATCCIQGHILKEFIYLFLERGEGEKEKEERNISVLLPLTCPLLGTWPVTQACALTGNRTGHLLVRRPELSPLSHTSEG